MLFLPLFKNNDLLFWLIKQRKVQFYRKTVLNHNGRNDHHIITFLMSFGLYPSNHRKSLPHLNEPCDPILRVKYHLFDRDVFGLIFPKPYLNKLILKT